MDESRRFPDSVGSTLDTGKAPISRTARAGFERAAEGGSPSKSVLAASAAWQES
jgi:hypothetical protein